MYCNYEKKEKPDRVHNFVNINDFDIDFKIENLSPMDD